MISYIASYNNQKYFIQAIEDLQLNVMFSLISNEFDFSDYVKKQGSQIENSKYLIVDMDAIQSTPEEFLQTLNNFRMLYTTKIIIVASGHTIGDQYLNHAFCSGIYDIITEEKEEIEKELKTCILKGKSFKDSLQFQITNPAIKEVNKPTTVIKERVVVKNNVKKIANKEVIGFMGTQTRCGVTHNCIVCAEYLRENGFSVSIVEIKREKESDYLKIKNWFDIHSDTTDMFTLHGITVYPDYSLKELHIILSKNYDFILIDFGVYKKEIEKEFIRTAVPIVISCSKPWEVEEINHIFESIHVDIIKEFYYIFDFTGKEMQTELTENMNPVNKIYCQSYIEDPFNGKNAGVFESILKEYLTEVTVSKQKNNILQRIGGVLRKNGKKKEEARTSDFV